MSWLTPSDGKRYCCRKRSRARSGASRICFRSQDGHAGSCPEEHLPNSKGRQKLHRTAIADTVTVWESPGFDFSSNSASAAGAGRTMSQTPAARCFASDFELGRRIHTAGAGSWLLAVLRYSGLRSR